MRIWVTGIGIVSPLAPTADGTMARLLAGDRGFGDLSLFELAGARSRVAAEVRGLDVAAIAGDDGCSWSRTDAMAVLAAREALAHAGLTGAELALDLVFGGTTAGMFETEGVLAEMAREPEAIAPLKQMLSHPLSATVDRLRRAVAPFRSARTLCSACSSSANAVALGAVRIRQGQAERVLVGGADGLCRLTFAGFGALGAMAGEPCRPFDERRRGLSLGEGAAFMLLESSAAARRRGAEPLAELRGWAMGAEAHHITNPEPSGEVVARLLGRAMASAGLGPRDVDYVNAHGTATRANDPMETKALQQVFGDQLERVRVSSSKGQLGHTLGAAGALEAAIAVLAIVHQQVPPTGGLERVDPACQLRHVRVSERTAIRAALSNSFGFGGMDTILAFAAPEAFEPLAAEPPRRVVVPGGASVGPLGLRSGGGLEAYGEPGPAPGRGAIEFDPSEHLDLGRARRIDRAGRMVATAAAAALADGGIAAEDGGILADAGAIVGSAWGAVDASAGYVRRVLERGAKMAPPAAFPNLVPSSPVAHGAIYHALRGPVFACFDLGATAEAAMVTAVELVEAGEAPRVLAGSVEESSEIAARALAPVCTGAPAVGPRSEGAQLLLFESLDAWRARATVDPSCPQQVAEVAWRAGWRGEGTDALATAPPPSVDGA
ncbi:MAG: beta-ketoacyl-[acyl-carrier-protein] synthase family protein, partial [Deltaproteobacteria bacterium]|nr:beta-ketoacyl-[acyl-carrier-protein] synthase family protein [Deltaproteobacteria bacterium]MBW2534676.1 beta-ketoacyl-[acyl-carrier-protein] synthase family protein [Deltaproteobacteria bacterium]